MTDISPKTGPETPQKKRRTKKKEIISNIIFFVSVLAFTAVITTVFDMGTCPSKRVIEAQDSAAKPVISQHVPDFSISDIHGTVHNIADYQGKVVILNFWASWCPPCIKEFPHFIEAANDYPDNVVVMALSSDHNNDAMMRFINKMDIPDGNFIVAQDEGVKITQGLFQTYRLPETFIIDQNGQMVKKIIGAKWGYADLKADIDALLP